MSGKETISYPNEWQGEAQMTCDEFTQLFMEQYVGDAVKDLRQKQFDNFAQNNMTILEYENEFDHLVRYVPQYHGMKEQKARRFIRGLRPAIRGACDFSLLPPIAR